MRAFSAACGLWWNGAFMQSARFYKQKGRHRGASPVTCDEKAALLDRDLLALRGRLLGKRQLEHAVLERRLGLRLVHFLRQREAARQLAVDALLVQHPLVLRSLLLALDLGLE